MGRQSACTNEYTVCVCGKGILLLAPIKVRVCVGRRDRMLALINTMCVCVWRMGDFYQLKLHVCLEKGTCTQL